MKQTRLWLATIAAYSAASQQVPMTLGLMEFITTSFLPVI